MKNNQDVNINFHCSLQRDHQKLNVHIFYFFRMAANFLIVLAFRENSTKGMEIKNVLLKHTYIMDAPEKEFKNCFLLFLLWQWICFILNEKYRKIFLNWFRAIGVNNNILKDCFYFFKQKIISVQIP